MPWCTYKPHVTLKLWFQPSRENEWFSIKIRISTCLEPNFLAHGFSTPLTAKVDIVDRQPGWNVDIRDYVGSCQRLKSLQLKEMYASPQYPSTIACKTLHPALELTWPLCSRVTMASTSVAKMFAINVPKGKPAILVLNRDSHQRVKVPRGANTRANDKCRWELTVAATTITVTQLKRPKSWVIISLGSRTNLYPTGIIV